MKQLPRIVTQLRAAWPAVQITIRGDSGFCREPIMARCEAHGVDHVPGSAQDSRLLALIAAEQEQARPEFERTKEPTRVFAELQYRALDSWSRERRVVARAEHLVRDANPRFVVTSPSAERRPARPLDEEGCCGRGEAESRIEGQQLHRFADRTSAQTMRANQIRLFSSSIAYTLPNALRRLGLAGTELAEAQCQAIRSKLLKVGASVRATVRKVRVHLASSCPYAEVSRRVHARLSRLRPVVLRCGTGIRSPIDRHSHPPATAGAGRGAPAEPPRADPGQSAVEVGGSRGGQGPTRGEP